MSTGIPTADTEHRRRTARAVVGLGISQLIGWGTVFSPLVLFADAMGRDLDLSRELIFSGIAIMLIVNAGLSPRVGRMVDRRGARGIMMIGSCTAAAAMLALSQARGWISYSAAWVLVGVAMTLMLSTVSLPGLVQVAGQRARAAITGLTMITGFTSTVFLPINASLLVTFGWRGAFVVFALLHRLICLPIHARVLAPARRPDSEEPLPRAVVPPGGDVITAEGALAPQQRLAACALIAVWSCMQGLITWGLYMQIIDVFKGHGMSQDMAIAVWQLNGPSQVAVRAGELLLSAGHSIVFTALASALFAVAGFGAFATLGVTLPASIAFAVLMGFGHGLFAIARNTLPLVLFGHRHYGTYMGWLNVPQNMAYALAPLVFAAVIGRVGGTAAIWLAAGASILSLLSVLALVVFCRRAGIGARVA